MSPWGWTPERSEGIWRHGSPWLRPLVVASPWITLGLLVIMLYVMSNSLTIAKGVLFDLSDSGGDEGASTSVVALVMPDEHGETMVFFDDARYMLKDVVSTDEFVRRLNERLAKESMKTMLMLVDRRIDGGDLMQLSVLAKRGGAEKVLFAEKSKESSLE